MLLNEKILKIMKDNEMSYGDLAKATGISKTTIYKYATGKTKKIPIDSLDKIAKALNVDVLDLFYSDAEKVAFPDVLLMNKGQVDKLSVAFVEILERLGAMYKDGLLTADEFQKAKDRILKENLI